MPIASVPSAKAVALVVNVGRVALGAAVLTAPEAAMRALGVDRASAARASWLVRTAGVRDGALGVGTVVAVLRGHNQTAWVLAGAACDAVDALVTGQAARQQRIDPVRGRLLAAGAVGSAAVCVLSAAGLLIRRR
jgi:hypothetical protein